MKILVYAYTQCNLGDDLFIDYLVKKFPNHKFMLMTENHCLYSKKYNNLECCPLSVNKITFLDRIFNKISNLLHTNLFMFSLSKYYTFLSRTNDVLLVLGGSMFIEKYPIITERNLREALLFKKFTEKKSFIVGSNFGPFKSNKYFKFYRNIFLTFTHISFREKYSFNLFKNELPIEKLSYYPDIIFSYKLPKYSFDKNTIGISLIDLTNRDHLKKYIDKYRDLLLRIITLNKEKEIRLFSFCDNEGDKKAIMDLLGFIKDTCNIKIISYNGDINNFLSMYLSTEIIYATRFHAVVLSLLAKQKVLPLIYSNKTKNMLRDINYNGNYIDISNIPQVCDRIILSASVFDGKLDSIISDSKKHLSSFENFL